MKDPSLFGNASYPKCHKDGRAETDVFLDVAPSIPIGGITKRLQKRSGLSSFSKKKVLRYRLQRLMGVAVICLQHTCTRCEVWRIGWIVL